jgi:hypothetical protein
MGERGWDGERNGPEDTSPQWRAVLGAEQRTCGIGVGKDLGHFSGGFQPNSGVIIG